MDSQQDSGPAGSHLSTGLTAVCRVSDKTGSFDTTILWLRKTTKPVFLFPAVQLLQLNTLKYIW